MVLNRCYRCYQSDHLPKPSPLSSPPMFPHSPLQLQQLDFRDYLASSSDDSGEDFAMDDAKGGMNGNGAGRRNKKEDKEAERERLRSLLLANGDKKGGKAKHRRGGGHGKEEEEEEEEDGEESDDEEDEEEGEMEEMEVTFATGLESLSDKLGRKKREKELKDRETVFEAYLRQRKEKKKERKRSKQQQGGEGEEGKGQGTGPSEGGMPAKGKRSGGGSESEGSDEDDLYDQDRVRAEAQLDPFFNADDDPFDDPFFNNAPSEGGKEVKSSASKVADAKGVGMSKLHVKEEERERRSEERERERREEERKRAELELLVMDEGGGGEEKGGGVKGFNLKKGKKGDEKGGKKRNKEGKEEGVREELPVDYEDPRFQALFSSPLFAIDPTDPRFRKCVLLNGCFSVGASQWVLLSGCFSGASRATSHVLDGQGLTSSSGLVVIVIVVVLLISVISPLLAMNLVDWGSWSCLPCRRCKPCYEGALKAPFAGHVAYTLRFSDDIADRTLSWSTLIPWIFTIHGLWCSDGGGI